MTFTVFLTGLAIVMLVLGYITAKINNIETLNNTMLRLILGKAKFEKYDKVRFINNFQSEFVVLDVKIAKERNRYLYKLVNPNSFKILNDIEEEWLEKTDCNLKKEENTSNEDDVS